MASNVTLKTAPAARPPHRRKPLWRRSPVWALILLLAAGAGAAWYQWGRAEAPQVTATATVELGDIEDSTTALGNLQPRDYVDVGTQVSGQLKTLNFDIGATVEKGVLLAEIDPTVYQSKVDADRAQLLNLRAQLADKQAQLALAQQQYQRQIGLARASATSQDAVQSAEATQRSAAAQVDAIKAQIQQTESTLKGDEANLGYTKIYAPMSGTIVSQTSKRGQTLNANQQAPIIYRIADLSTMTVTTQVSEADVSKLRIGMDAYFTTLGQPEKRWYGKLRQVLPTPEILNNVVLYDALFDVPNPKGELMTQMSAQVFFISAAAKNVPVVPMAALRPVRRGDGRGTYIARVLQDDGSIEERHVTVGVTNRVSAEIKSGLSAGEKVVLPTAGGANRPGQPQQRPQNQPMRTPRLS
jgi:membrane fusion protein, macrolide-specific efflux system